MNLVDILILLLLVVIAIQFWRIRGITEYVNRYLLQYCQSQNVQLLTVARLKTKFTLVAGKPDWHTFFTFEFSSDGTNKYTGLIELKGMRIVATEMPPYTIN